MTAPTPIGRWCDWVSASRAASEPVGPEALRGTADAVRHALQLPWVVVDVEDGPSTASGTPTADGIRVPLVHSGAVVGHLEVGLRRVGRPLSAR